MDLFGISFVSPPTTKVLSTKERHIDGSLVKSISLSENTPSIRQTYCFSFFSVIAVLNSVFLYFMMTLIVAPFHAQMFFDCSDSL